VNHEEHEEREEDLLFTTKDTRGTKKNFLYWLCLGVLGELGGE
jgi:hypothetical protein